LKSKGAISAMTDIRQSAQTSSQNSTEPTNGEEGKKLNEESTRQEKEEMDKISCAVSFENTFILFHEF
jgi:hypothetical protein